MAKCIQPVASMGIAYETSSHEASSYVQSRPRSRLNTESSENTESHSGNLAHVAQERLRNRLNTECSDGTESHSRSLTHVAEDSSFGHRVRFIIDGEGPVEARYDDQQLYTFARKPSNIPSERCAVSTQGMAWVEGHIAATLAADVEEQRPLNLASWISIVARATRLYFYHLDLSNYWPRRAAPAATPVSWCLTYVALCCCLYIGVRETISFFSRSNAPLVVDTETGYDDVTTYAPPLAVTLAYRGGHSLFQNGTDPEGGQRNFKVLSRRICHGRSQHCDGVGGVNEMRIELPMKACSDHRLFEAFTNLKQGGTTLARCIDFDQIAARAHNGAFTGGFLGAGDRFDGPVLRGTYGNPDYRFIEIQLLGNWTSTTEAIDINVYASLFGTDASDYLDKTNGSPSHQDPDKVQKGNFEYGARKWGRLLFLQLTPSLRNSEELFLEPFHFTWSERCSFGTSQNCNAKQGTYVTSDFPPATQVSNKVAHDGRMATIYLRLRTAVTIHHAVRLNKTCLDFGATLGGMIGIIFFFFNFLARDVANGLYHKARMFKTKLHEASEIDPEIQFRNRVQGLVDEMPIDEVLRYLLDQSYKHKEVLERLAAEDERFSHRVFRHTGSSLDVSPWAQPSQHTSWHSVAQKRMVGSDIAFTDNDETLPNQLIT